MELEQAIADLHGGSGVLLRWQVSGPLSHGQAAPLIQHLVSAKLGDEINAAKSGLRTLLALGSEARVSPPPGPGNELDKVFLAYTDLRVPKAAAVQFLAGSNGALRVWLNGQPQFERTKVRPFRPDSERFDGNLVQGVNRLLVHLTAAKAPEFHLRFRHKSSRADLEQLTQAALQRDGNPELGRQLFFNAEKTLCIKCHRLGDQGGMVGPALTGVGKRFARIFIIESILEPSRSITASYETQMVVLKNGKVLTGVRVAETDGELTLGDNQGAKHIVLKSDIEERQPLPLSTMPEGLEKRLTADEFVDLIAFFDRPQVTVCYLGRKAAHRSPHCGKAAIAGS